MFYSSDIKRHIFSLKEDQIFTTRDLLKYARRSTVDKVLSTLVKDKVIHRLARGVFVREITPSITPLTVAKAKLEAFGKKLVEQHNNVNAQLPSHKQEVDRRRYRTDGRSSSFHSVFGRIAVANAAPRMLRLAGSRHGDLISYFWDQARQGVTYRDAREKVFFTRCDLQALRQNIRWMPYWLGNIHMHRPLSYKLPAPTGTD